LFVRYTLDGKDYHRRVDVVMEWCENCTHGLTQADAARFIHARDRYVVELEIGKLPFNGPVRRM
jgi:hypothetical protein